MDDDHSHAAGEDPEAMAALIRALKGPPMKLATVYQRIQSAGDAGQGLRLSRFDVETLCRDTAVMTRADLDDHCSSDHPDHTASDSSDCPWCRS